MHSWDNAYYDRAEPALPLTMDAESVSALVEQGLPGATCTVTDLTGTADHWGLEVVWGGFSDMGLLAQHKAVMEVVRPHMEGGSGAIHAVQISTRAS